MITFLMVMGMGLIFSQSITVTAPAGGATWHKGDTPTITWTKSGTMDANVKITLRNADASLHTVITMSTPNDGSYPWMIPGSIPNGTYLMRVKTVDNAVTDDSPAFTIADAAPEAASINITSPVASTDWCLGENGVVNWTKSGTMDANVKITLRNSDGSLNTVMIMSTPNDGNYSWPVPSGFAVGNYKVRVKTVDNAVFDESNTFEIKDCGGGEDDGGIIDPGILERLKDLLRRVERIPWWKGPRGPWPGPGPNPCLSCPVFDISKLRELLAKAGLKEQVGVMLFKGNQKIADFGKFGPSKGRLGKRAMKMNRLSRMGLMKNRAVVRGLSPEKGKMFGQGDGYKLVLINAQGKLIGENGIILNNIQKEMR